MDKQTTQVALTPASVWNTVAPVSRLPSELLAYIFVLRAGADYNKCSVRTGVPQWVNVSYVCSRWRFVALDCPILWSYLFVASPRWTDASLVRSKEVLLWVHVDFNPVHRETALKFMEQVTPHSERFQECRLDLYPGDDEVVMPMLSSRSAPLLHTLAITHKEPTYRVIMPLNGDDEVSFTSNVHGSNGLHTLFNGTTPILRYFRLKDFCMPWYSPTLCRLTVLRLRHVYSSARFTAAEFKMMLSHMPDLAQLYLDDAVRSVPHNSARLEAEKVHLPRLAHLSIAEPFSTVVHLLSCIDILATTAVRLRFRNEIHSPGNDYTPLYALLSQSFRNFEATSVKPICTMVMNRTSDHVSISFSRSERKCGRHNHNLVPLHECGCDVPLKLAIQCRNTAYEALRDDWILGICRSVPLASLNILFLNSWRVPLALWFKVFWHLQGLRYIEILEGGLTDLIAMFTLPPSLHTADGPMDHHTGQPFAPSLETLCIASGVKIPRWWFRCHGHQVAHKCCLTLLRDTLAKRRATGYALKRLVINGSLLFSRKEISSLAKEVPQVLVHTSVKFRLDDACCEHCGYREETSEESGGDGLSNNGNLGSGALSVLQ